MIFLICITKSWLDDVIAIYGQLTKVFLAKCQRKMAPPRLIQQGISQLLKREKTCQQKLTMVFNTVHHKRQIDFMHMIYIMHNFYFAISILKGPMK